MKALAGAVNQEKALGNFAVILKSSRTFLHSCIPRWVPAEQAAAPCSLDCLASDVADRQLVARLGERVEDGTRCGGDTQLNLCLDGVCEVRTIDCDDNIAEAKGNYSLMSEHEKVSSC